MADTTDNTVSTVVKGVLANVQQTEATVKASQLANGNATPNTTTTTPSETQTPVTTPQSTTPTGTETVTTPKEQTVTNQVGDQSTTATVTTPTTTEASGATPITTTTPDNKVSTEVSNGIYESSSNFNDYAVKTGYKVEVIDGEVYVNNSLVDWRSLGMTFQDGKLSGAQAQYDQLLSNIKSNGYTTGNTFSEYAVNAGYKVSRSNDGKYLIVNGIPIDPSLYDGMYKLNGNWVGTADAYKYMIDEAMQPTKVDPDYLASTDFTSYATKKGYTASINSSNQIEVNGMTFPPQYYPNLKYVNGKWVGDEATYRQLIVDSMLYSKMDINQYLTSKGYEVKANEDGYIVFSEKGKNNWRAIHSPYWDEQSIGQGGIRITWQGITGWRASEEVYDQIINEANSRSDYNLEDYARVLGYKVGTDQYGNITIDGKSIAGTSPTNFRTNNEEAYANALKAMGNTTDQSYQDLLRYGQAQPTYYKDVYLVDGKFVGSEQAYRKILTDLASRSNQSFSDYASSNNSTVTTMNGKVYVNGTLVDVSNTSIQVINGQVYGTEADYKALIDKVNKGYEYTSEYEDEIQSALQEIQDFEVYQTPEETLSQINALMQSAQEKFSYDPTQDSALKTAQKEAERVVRESSGSRGLLYSSGTVSQAAKKAGELIPTYEQQAYSRWSDQKTRDLNLMQTIMDWDEMQSQRNVDQLNLIKTKFDTIMSMDTRSLEKFKVLLDQRNADRQAALELESLNIEMRQSELDLAWKRTEALGYVDQEASIILGVPVGTKAQWVQQLVQQNQYELQQLAKNNEYQVALQQNQANIERSLTEYKAALDEASQQRILAQQYSNDKALAQQNYNNQLYLAKKYGT